MINITIVKKHADPCTYTIDQEGKVIGSGVGDKPGSFHVDELHSSVELSEDELVALAVYANMTAHIKRLKDVLRASGFNVEVVL
jgi:hypothetical protein